MAVLDGRSWSVCDCQFGVTTGAVRLHLSLLSDLQRVIDFNAQIPDSAFELAVPEQ